MKQSLLLLFCGLLLFFAACTSQTTDPTTTDARTKFTGGWICRETISGSTTAFTITINKLGSSDTVQIYNFSNYGNSAVAIGYVVSNSLTIPAQTIGVTNIPVQGSGVYSTAGGTEKITMNYQTDGQAASAVCTRQ